MFKITTFGESHGEALGVVIDGIESDFPLDTHHIQQEMDRRKPGQSELTTQRKEYDTVRICSGLFEGKTTGTPLSMILFNSDSRSRDYDSLKDVYRPGHGDYAYERKYSHRDHRGGGRSSGRETAARVAAGAVAKQLLASRGIQITAFTLMIRGLWCGKVLLDTIEDNPVRCPDPEKAAEMHQLILDAASREESLGGIVECRCSGVPAGLGDPVFDKLDALISQAVVSVGAVKGIEFGKGFQAASMEGSAFNDSPGAGGSFSSNHSGGISAGISTGQEIRFRAAVRPTPSIGQPQQTIDTQGKLRTIEIEGRHDPCILPRIVPVIESMAALVLIDRYYLQFGKKAPPSL